MVGVAHVRVYVHVHLFEEVSEWVMLWYRFYILQGNPFKLFSWSFGGGIFRGALVEVPKLHEKSLKGFPCSI